MTRFDYNLVAILDCADAACEATGICHHEGIYPDQTRSTVSWAMVAYLNYDLIATECQSSVRA